MLQSAETAPLMVEATPLGVRAALAEMKARFGTPLPESASLGMAETVLAEVLNNIVEHAYGPTSPGPIELRMHRSDLRLSIDVRDYGVPMPGEKLPEGGLPGDDVLTEAPSEGGYGWFLIRSFARNIEYRREGDQNRLSFVVPLQEEH
ncbi:ATP-binding protein [Rhodovulum sp. P5]|uniref:ATP-binding protein n=1 Tax=Rhodovulum sp. P5 TaxID=1564506 RepID=UPI0015613052|nr:ATP-binding protein [Rhodovulum sp. P5]